MVIDYIDAQLQINKFSRIGLVESLRPRHRSKLAHPQRNVLFYSPPVALSALRRTQFPKQLLCAESADLHKLFGNLARLLIAVLARLSPLARRGSTGNKFP